MLGVASRDLHAGSRTWPAKRSSFGEAQRTRLGQSCSRLRCCRVASSEGHKATRPSVAASHPDPPKTPSPRREARVPKSQNPSLAGPSSGESGLRRPLTIRSNRSPSLLRRARVLPLGLSPTLVLLPSHGRAPAAMQAVCVCVSNAHRERRKAAPQRVQAAPPDAAGDGSAATACTRWLLRLAPEPCGICGRSLGSVRGRATRPGQIRAALPGRGAVKPIAGSGGAMTHAARPLSAACPAAPPPLRSCMRLLR